MARPIPKYRLPHTVQYTALLDELSRGKSYDTAIDINNVKIDLKSMYKYMKDGSRQIEGKAKMFYDSVNSTPAVSFKENDKITFEGTEYIIGEVLKFWDNTRLHHYELILK